MKRYILVFLFGGLVGALCVLVLQETTARSGSPAGGVTQEDLERAIAKALRGVEGQIAELRVKAESRVDGGAAAPAPARETSRTPPPSPEGPEERPGRAKRPVEPVRREAEMLSPARIDRLKEIEGFARHEDVRRRWMFRSDEEVLAEFGAPTEVTGLENGEEQWSYRIEFRDEAGEEDQRYVYLYFHNGRLVRAND